MPSPIKPSFKTELLPILLIIASLGLSVYFYQHFPARVASHWNFRGEIDGYGSKGFMAFFFPVLLLAMYLLFLFIPHLDPKKENYAKFANVYHIFKGLILSVLFLIYLLTGLVNLGCQINVGIAVASLIGLMMVILGAYMGKIKSNWFVGIRTPWTLSSENNWDKTHRVGGRCFVIFGLLIIIAPFLPPVLAMVAFFGGAVLVTLGTIVYSYWLFRKENKK